MFTWHHPFLLTFRFHLTENVAGRSSGEPYTLNNFFFFCAAHSPAIYGLIIFPSNIALISKVLPLLLLFLGLNTKAIHLIGKPSLTSILNLLSLLFYCYYFGYCSDELAACILPGMARPHSTRHMSIARNYCVELSNARINQ